MLEIIIINFFVKLEFFNVNEYFYGFQLLEMATRGDFRHVDMLVKDIYGERGDEYTSLGLAPTIIASTFGKAIHFDKDEEK